MDNKNQPAFPKIKTSEAKDRVTGNSYSDTFSEGGLTKREYFAGLAMQSFISTKGLTTFDAVKNTEGVASDVVEASYAIADLMLNNK